MALETKLEWIPVAVAPHVKRLADAISARVETIVKEAVDRAIAALAIEVPHATADRSDHDPVPPMRRSAERGLHRDDERGVRGPDPGDVDRPHAQQPTQAANPRCAKDERTARLVDPLESALGPDLAKMLTPPSASGPLMAQVRRPDYRPDPTARTADGKRAPRCSKCGFIGGRATGCGTSHPTQPRAAVLCEIEAPRRPKAGPDAEPLTAIASERRSKPSAAALELAKRRIAERRERAPREVGPAARAPEDDNPNAEERWTAGEIEEARELAEANKRAGELPRASAGSLFDVQDGEVTEIEQVDSEAW